MTHTTPDQAQALGLSKDFETVADIPEGYSLLCDQLDIRSCLDSIGKLEHFEDTGCLFVRVGEGEYTSVYQCLRSVPVLTHRVYRLSPIKL